MFPRPKKVLIIDDSPTVLLAAKSALEQIGHDVATLTSSKDAAAAVLRERPDIVLLDLSMPNMDGETLLKVMRRSFLRNVRVILFSDRQSDELKRLTAELKADAYVSKSGRWSDVMKKLQISVNQS